ncbi:MAG: aminopeptidase N C-terminal domain-containing protein, partial [Deltaproteobacteria bacterium]|nr:aminopeptidase N C-terminal domain-containing protein [Deltaproteobacteria bacterium]
MRELSRHPDFTLKNPNRVRSLVGTFSQGNPAFFHDAAGSGYAFLADQVLALDAINPQTAARLLTPLTRWQRYNEQRQRLMQA